MSAERYAQAGLDLAKAGSGGTPCAGDDCGCKDDAKEANDSAPVDV